MTPDDAYDERAGALRRRAKATRAAYAMHEKHPELAASAGRKGGAARVAQMADPKAYGQWLARRRWHGSLAGPAPTRTQAASTNTRERERPPDGAAGAEETIRSGTSTANLNAF